MDIYENIVVGNFLYGFGLAMGIQSPAGSLVCVNLLQQTPLDRTLGDVLLTNSGFYRLIEFKRAQSRSDKERLKKDLLRAALEERADPGLFDVSRSVHWYLESELVEEADCEGIARGVFQSRAAPYIDFDPANARHDLAGLVQATADAACSPAMDATWAQQCRGYLTFAAHVASSAGAGGTAGSGCLLITSDGSGRLGFAPLTNLADLVRPVRQLLTHGTQTPMHMDMEQERERRAGLERSLGRDLGMER